MSANLQEFLKTIDPQILDTASNAGNNIESPEALKRAHSMTVALLRHAHALINDAENQLTQQEQRIASLENLAVTDDLTGLLNRRGFENAVKRELQRLQRKQLKGGALCLIDLDDFKPINDTYGHHAGDLCIQAVGDCLTKMTRTTDVVSRLGGDEFSMYISDIEQSTAESKIQEINTALNALEVKWKNIKISIAASIGHIMISYPAAPYEELFDEADQNMYRSKTSRKGRSSQKTKILKSTA